MPDGGSVSPEPTVSDATREARIEWLFGEVLEQAEEDREAWLRNAGNDDPGVLAEVRSLLEAYRLAPGLLDEVRPAAVGVPLPSGGLEEGDTLGPWRIIRQLASGGMGTVYLGERIDDSFRMQVAIKVLSARVVHPGLLSQ
ncbi:MAG TPA: hypothetical protein VF720_02075, partial [Candidatus Eisenbacteria bacterium]